MERHHDHSTDSIRGSKSKLPRSEMKFSNVSLTLVNSEGLPPTLGSLTIYRDTKKIVHTDNDTGKEISFYLDNLSLPTNKPPMREVCLNRSRGSSLAEDLVYIEIEARYTKSTASIYEKLRKLKCEDSIATLKALGKCAKCGQEYGKVVNVVRANTADLVEYRLRPYIGQCGHVFCGECVGDAGDHSDSEDKEREQIQCTLCPGSMKCKWTYCQGFSKLVDRIDDITTLLEQSKDHDNDLKTALKKAQEDLINAQNEKDEKYRELVKEKGEMETRMMLEKDEMKKEITTLKHHLSEEKKKNKNSAKEPEDKSCVQGECAKCELKEKTDRLHICLGCAKDTGVWERAGEPHLILCSQECSVNVNDPQAQEHILVKYVDEMTPLIFCGNCFVNDHQGHRHVKYIDEVRRLITSAIEKTDKFVESIDKSFIDVLNKRSSSFVEWQEKTANKRTLKFDEITYKEALDIYYDLVRERRIVRKTVEKTVAEFDKGLTVFEESYSNQRYMPLDVLLTRLRELNTCENCGNRFRITDSPSTTRRPRVSICGHAVCEHCLIRDHTRLRNVTIFNAPCPRCHRTTHREWTVCSGYVGLLESTSQSIDALTEAKRDIQRLNTEVRSLTDQKHKMIAQQEEIASEEHLMITEKRKLLDREREIAAEQRQLDTDKQNLLRDQKKLASSKDEIAAKQRSLKEGKDKLFALTVELSSRENTLKSRSQKLAERNQKFLEKERTLNENNQKLVSQREELSLKESALGDEKKSLSEREEKLDSKEEALKAEGTKLSSWNQELNTKEDAVTALTQELSERQEEFKSKERTLNQENRKLSERNQKLESNENSLAAKSRELSERQEELESKERTLNEESEKLDSKKDALNEENKKLSTRQQEIAAQEHSLNEESEKLSDRYQALESKENSLASKTRELSERQEEFESKERTLNEESEKLKSKKDALNEENRKLSTRQQEIAAQEHSLNEESEKLAAQSKKLDSRERTLRKSQAQLLARQDVLSRMEKTQAEKEQNMEVMQKAIDENEKAIDEKEKAIDEKEKSIDEKEKIIDDKKKATKKKQKTISEKEKAVDEKENTIKEKEKAIDEKEKIIDEKQKIIEAERKAFESTEKRLNEEIVELQRHLEEERLKMKTVVTEKEKEADDVFSRGPVQCAKCKVKEKKEKMYICVGCTKKREDGETVVTEKEKEADDVFSEGPVQCAQCKVKEKKERMYICVGCAKEREDGEIASFLLCARCVLDDHQSHDVAKYGDEVRRLITVAVGANETFVNSLAIGFVKMMDKRSAVFAEWIKSCRSNDKFNFAELTYGDALGICTSLASERHAVQKMWNEFGKSCEAIEQSLMKESNKQQKKAIKRKLS